MEVALAERVRALRAGALPVERPPALYRFNGIGTTLLGHYLDPDFAPTFYTVHFFHRPLDSRNSTRDLHGETSS